MKDIVTHLRKTQNIRVQSCTLRYVGASNTRSVRVRTGKTESILIEAGKGFVRDMETGMVPLSLAKKICSLPSQGETNLKIDPQGGMTFVELYDVETNAVMGQGKYVFRGYKTFKRARGFQIALGLALKEAKITV